MSSIKTPWSVILVRVIAFATIGICTFLLVTEDGYSDDYASAAIGAYHSAQYSPSETKMVNIGHRDTLGLGLIYDYEVGGWSDVAGHGRKSSGYGATQVGVQTDGPVFARIMTGPALITTPDVYLGGVFQFKENFYLGLKGNNGNAIGFEYQHISSAGLELPNRGRDFVGFEASIPF